MGGRVWLRARASGRDKTTAPNLNSHTDADADADAGAKSETEPADEHCKFGIARNGQETNEREEGQRVALSGSWLDLELQLI